MVSLYTGTPGSGKSVHAAQDVISWLRRGKGLIANYPINEEAVGKCKSHAIYWDNAELTVGRLVQYAYEHHQIGKEHQTLVIVDEAQVKFNCRDLQRKDRQDWVNLFTQHRKLGFDFILITQFDRMLDRQIRAMTESEWKHRKLNNYGKGGFLLSLFTGMSTWFICIEYWYGGNKLKLGQKVFRYKKRYGKISDSYRLFADLGGSEWDRMASGAPQSGGAGAGCSSERGPVTAPPLPPDTASPAPSGDSDSSSEPGRPAPPG